MIRGIRPSFDFTRTICYFDGTNMPLLAEEPMAEATYAKGLEGVIAAESKICRVDGEKGELFYSGYSIQDLVKNCDYEEVSYLLLYHDLPTADHRTVRDTGPRQGLYGLAGVVHTQAVLQPVHGQLDHAVDITRGQAAGAE